MTPDEGCLGLMGNCLALAADQVRQRRSQRARADAGLVDGLHEIVERVTLGTSAQSHQDSDGQVDHASRGRVAAPGRFGHRVVAEVVVCTGPV